MESHDYEHYRNLTLMFFFEKLLEKGGEIEEKFMESCRKVSRIPSINYCQFMVIAQIGEILDGM